MTLPPVRGPLKAKFVAAIRRLLHPVVRQLVTYGVSYPALSRLLKQIYVEVAEQDFALPFKRLTDSRVSLLTGINRKEIVQLRRRPSRSTAVVEVEDTLATHVLGRWMASPPYASRDGVPRRLPYDVSDSATPSFARLVREVGVDIPVRSVLDELLRQGAVELLPNGDVAVVREANIPQDDIEAKLTLLGADPGELFTTIVHNIEHPEAPLLQRKVVYDNIGADALVQLREEARRLGEEFIRRANALLATQDRDRNRDAPGGRRTRVVLGTHYFEEPYEPSPPAPVDSPLPGRIRRSR
ncbi:DUF6502 family protein [Candidatus Binatia bacterium]|nr:DUF6502 family protein [Candidatus Binatia bacterium]